ncbi:MAG: helix-turn-helix domain-containing protein [Thermoleophilaceae bacterium]
MDLRTDPGIGWPLVSVGPIALLDADPELAAELAEEQGEAARRLAAPAYTLRRGPLPPIPARAAGGHMGLLIIRGLVLREVSFLGRPSAELLGPGDLIRPCTRALGEDLLGRSVSWFVVEKAVVADIGGSLINRLAGLPPVVEALLDRSIARAETLALDRSIASHVRVDVRVLGCLWHLAERWGIVTPGAVRIELPLTHALLARMVGARRPTVTTALQRLIALGYLRRESGAFVLIGGAAAVEELARTSPSNDGAIDAAA